MKRDGRRLMYFVPPNDGTFEFGDTANDRIPSPSSRHRFVIGQRNNLAVPEMEFRLLGDTLLQRWAGVCAQVFERTGDWDMAHRTSPSSLQTLQPWEGPGAELVGVVARFLRGGDRADSSAQGGR